MLTSIQHATYASQVSILPQRAPEQNYLVSNGFIHQRCATLGSPPAVLAALLHALRPLRWAEMDAIAPDGFGQFYHGGPCAYQPAFAQALASAQRRRGNVIWNFRPVIPEALSPI